MPKRKVFKRFGKAKLSYVVNKDGLVLWKVGCGWHITSSGKRGATMFYLGMDESAALIKRDLLRAEWKKCKSEGHDTWPSEILSSLVDRGIASEATAKTSSDGNIRKVAGVMLKDAIQKNAQLDQLRESSGNLALNNVPAFMATLASQEFADDDMIQHFRKALKHFGYERPIDALKYWSELHSMVQEIKVKEQGGVTINFGNLIPVDASEHTRKIEAIVRGSDAVEDSNRGS